MAYRVLLSHLLYCGQVMPIEWVKANSKENCEFQQAMNLALTCLKENFKSEDRKMSKIKQSTAEDIMPFALRAEFGVDMGEAIWKTFQIIDQTEEAVQTVLKALRKASSDTERSKIINIIWQRYYRKIAVKAIEIS